jgi:hypothetical protein
MAPNSTLWISASPVLCPNETILKDLYVMKRILWLFITGPCMHNNIFGVGLQI